jgi:exocyst complex component 7
VATNINSLTALSRAGKRPAYGAIFMLNNVSYLMTHILLEPENPALFDLLSKPTQDLLNSNFRTAKAAYFDANFSPLMQLVTEDHAAGSKGKTAAKEKFTRFFDLLEEVGERHRVARVLEGDDEGRETVRDEVVKLIVPSLQTFMRKAKEKDFGKSMFFSSSCCVMLSDEFCDPRLQTLRNVCGFFFPLFLRLIWGSRHQDVARRTGRSDKEFLSV